ncbi:sterol desaturase family protein [Mucilaginibacter sp. FT3.2]|uniref:sterol desaturase family protein n=1 Tax=Mucilaginibacter sp. FT3.2 TaxID=2723090 RepID=UPI00161A533D|nr:sterol desaturase family protein [Mucilaginibacter sp. FT3.2]MBB6229872.1 sterol desaturase/sphingolipid hydroxylase (fatty acid hydroxylase superfamily) [Mucilaginibacter sp. FT3.2]
MPLQKVLTITSVILACWLVFIIAWERISPYRKGLAFFREGFWIDLVWYTLIQSYFLKILIFDYIIMPLQKHFDLSHLHLMSNWPVALQVLFFVVTHDLYIYLFHRFQHSNKALWRIHEAHHSGKEVDFLAGSRSHIMEIIINQTIEFAPIILLGANPVVVPIKALIDAMFGMFIHANIKVKLGKLKYLINTPELHLWHHANYQEVFHANFSTKLSVWDYLFGTVYDPGHAPGNKPENWGLYYDYPRDYFLQHVFSIKRFDEKKLLKYPWFKWYYTLRLRLIDRLDKFMPLKPQGPEVDLQPSAPTTPIPIEDNLIQQN